MEKQKTSVIHNKQHGSARGVESIFWLPIFFPFILLSLPTLKHSFWVSPLFLLLSCYHYSPPFIKTTIIRESFFFLPKSGLDNKLKFLINIFLPFLFLYFLFFYYTTQRVPETFNRYLFHFHVKRVYKAHVYLTHSLAFFSGSWKPVSILIQLIAINVRVVVHFVRVCVSVFIFLIYIRHSASCFSYKLLYKLKDIHIFFVNLHHAPFVDKDKNIISHFFSLLM